MPRNIDTRGYIEIEVFRYVWTPSISDEGNYEFAQYREDIETRSCELSDLEENFYGFQEIQKAFA